MAKLIVLITARLDEGHRIGEAWRAAGAPGVTFIESYGIRSLQNASKGAEILSGMLSMLEIIRDNEETSIILLSLVNDDVLVSELFRVTESILGDMEEPNNGIVFSLDVERAIGIRDHSKK
jgi:hypothetical protein